MVSAKSFPLPDASQEESTSGLKTISITVSKPGAMHNWHFRRQSFLLVAIVWLGLQSGGVEGHLASFISSEGRPNLTPRPIRGPTVPTMPYPPSSTELLRLPGFTFRGGGERKMYLRNMNDGSFADGVPRNMIFEAEDKPTFVPYIGPRALSSVNEYLRHLRDNLEALHSSEYVDTEDVDEGGDYDSDVEIPSFPHDNHHDRQHSRRHVSEDSSWNSPQPQLLPLSDNPHMPNRRQFLEAEPFLIRRTNVPSNYSPSWSYTKLGLGKKKRGGGRVMKNFRPWQQ